MIEAVTGSTALASLLAAPSAGRALTKRSCRRSGRAGGQADGVAVLGVPDDLARQGCVPARGAAELAHQALAPAGVEVHVLARQRGAAAVGTTAAVGLQRADTAAQEHPLELL